MTREESSVGCVTLVLVVLFGHDEAGLVKFSVSDCFPPGKKLIGDVPFKCPTPALLTSRIMTQKNGILTKVVRSVKIYIYANAWLRHNDTHYLILS